MEQFKRAKVIMLPTNNNSHIYHTKVNNILGYVTGKVESDLEQFPNQTNTQNQHLYITSDDKIKEGDWIIGFNNIVTKAKNNTLVNMTTTIGKICKKIIATTDTSLNYIKHDDTVPYPKGEQIRLSQPSQQFIEKYIESYNKGEVIIDVLVEYEAYVETGGYLGIAQHLIEDKKNWKYQLKVNPKNNTITIKKLKDSWNKEEVIKLLKLLKKDTINSIDLDINTDNLICDLEINKWIEENL